MSDITDPRALWLKAVLFVFLGTMAGWLVWQQTRQWDTLLLLTICVWAFARAYYFAFYVIEKYADPSFRYSGLISLLKYVFRNRD
jgi:hypothetical protein